MKTADLRIDYKRETLDESAVAPDPFRQFEKWFQEAEAAKIPEPNAMTLVTATRDGRPSAAALDRCAVLMERELERPLLQVMWAAPETPDAALLNRSFLGLLDRAVPGGDA